jgi:hypothetical protein
MSFLCLRLYYVIQLQVRTRRSQASASYSEFLSRLDSKCEQFSRERDKERGREREGGDEESKRKSVYSSGYPYPTAIPITPPRPGQSDKGSSVSLSVSPSLSPSTSAVSLSQSQSEASSSGASVPALVPLDRARGIFAVVSQELQERAECVSKSEHWRVITVKKSLPMLCAFHASLSRLLEPLDITPPAFPDPYEFGLFSDLLSDSIEKVRGREREKDREKEREKRRREREREKEKSLSLNKQVGKGKALDESTKHTFERMLEALQSYFQNILALFEFMDELEVEHCKALSSLSLATADALSLSLSPSGSQTDLSLSQSLSQSQSVSVSLSPDKDAVKFALVARQVGRLFSRLLVSTDMHALLSTTDQAVQLMRERERDRERQRQREIVSIETERDSPSGSLSPPRSSNAGSGREIEREKERERDSEGSVFWAEEVRGGLSASFEGLTSHKETRFYAKDESDLLKIQRDRCLSCGESLQYKSGSYALLGYFDNNKHKNYEICRYFGGLFCKKWCHSMQVRPLPYRILNYWDFKGYSVCKLAALFLDRVWEKPLLLSLSRTNRLLVEGVVALQQLRQSQRVIRELLPILFFEYPEKIITALSKTITKGRSHLLLAEDLFSLEDLLAIHKGALVEQMQRLSNFMVKLRDSMLLQKNATLL